MRFEHAIGAIDAHAGGEPLRIVTSGVPPLRGATMLARREDMRARFDDLRRVLMWEPRGHDGMYGCVLTPPVSPEADYGVIFMHNEGYSTMCGHGIIALTTALCETGAFPCDDGVTAIAYDSPAGLIRAKARVDAGRVQEVTFENVPSFLFAKDLRLRIGSVEVVVDVVYGGAFYALAPLAALAPGLSIEPGATGLLVQLGMEVKRALEEALEITHPMEPGLHGLYGAILTGPPRQAGTHGRNVTIFAEGQVDRSPCGTGTAARLAALYARGALKVGDDYLHESIVGSTFGGRIVGETEVGPFPAVIPEITGRGFITGFQQFVLDNEDEVGRGFLVR